MEEIKKEEPTVINCIDCDRSILEILYVSQGHLHLKCRLCGSMQSVRATIYLESEE